MKEKIEKVRSALDELEKELIGGGAEQVMRDLSALELPEIIEDVVDYLMPIITPYMAAYYWHLFRHSVLATGQQYLRCSTRRLQNGVIESAYSQARAEKSNRPVSLRSVREALSDLEQIGAIRKEGEPTRDGTLYKVLIPEEIEACRKAMSAREASQYKRVDINVEVDYYNVRENRHKIFERDGYKCAYCGKQLTRFTATLDHVKPVSGGGDNSYENVITACLGCNSTKTGKSLADFLADRGNAAATPTQHRDGETVT